MGEGDIVNTLSGLDTRLARLGGISPRIGDRMARLTLTISFWGAAITIRYCSGGRACR
jgi:hypothetical protein